MVAERNPDRVHGDGEQWFVSCGPCLQAVWIARSDGSDAYQVTPPTRSNPPSNTDPSWSPDRKQIVFEEDIATGPPQLAIVSVRGRRERELGVTGTHPSWGAPGIAYVSGTSIRLIRFGAGRSRLLARAPNGVAALAWSRNDELAALEGSAYGRHVVIYAASGRQVARFPLPASRFGALGIAWSPDGKHLLLTAWVRGARPGLYEVDTHGLQLRHLVARIDACCASWR
jgi:hypothetical protein